MEKRVYRYNPSKVFLLIGTNDIQKGYSDTKIIDNIKKILDSTKSTRPQAKIYIESLYPVVDDSDGAEDRTNKRISDINDKIKDLAKEENITYIDVYDSLLNDSKDNLNEEYTKEGLHMSDKGYEVIANVLKKYVNEKN